MYSGRAMKSMGPHERAGVYKNQIVGAVWLLFGIGVLTLASPFLRLGVEPGLLTPAALGHGQPAGSPAVVSVAVVCGGLLILLGVLLGLGRAKAALLGALVILADWPLVLIGSRAADFPELITSVLRLFYLFYLLRGYRAVRMRATILETTRQADKDYDEELKARARKRGAKDDKPVDSRFEPEDEYQG